MRSAFDQFVINIRYVKDLDALFLHLRDGVRLPNDLSDLLRAELVSTVSAMDKLIHELIRIGMLQSFQGHRPKTKKFLAFAISLETHTSITSTSPTSLPPAEYWFEKEVNQKHKILSFQDPDKIADGLSLIWDEQHKWQRLASALEIPEQDVKTRLRSIISRRNQIVHEADFDVVSGRRNAITKADVDVVVTFLARLSEEIFNAVR